MFIIIVNQNFLPDDSRKPYLYGATHYALKLGEIFLSQESFYGFILYKRDDTLEAPVVENGRVLNSYNSLTIRFSFNMPEAVLKESFDNAIKELMTDDKQPVIYLQTNVLLRFIPENYYTILTHHGPFSENVEAALGERDARLAFDWDHTKYDFLKMWQRIGVSEVKRRSNVMCLETSRIQSSYLAKARVPSHKIMDILPPLDFLDGAQRSADLSHELKGFIEKHDGSIVFSVVSRFDHFKNIDLFIAAGIKLTALIDDVKILVIGDADESEMRRRYYAMIPEHVRHRFLLHPKIGRRSLLTEVFPQLRSKGIFVCTSRYDLTPYTVLEAIRSGVVTLVPRSKFVGVSYLMPREYTFNNSLNSLVNSLVNLISSKPSKAFQKFALGIREKTTSGYFLSMLKDVIMDRIPEVVNNGHYSNKDLEAPVITD